MKDFTKKGTKLPVIPVGTEYSIPNIFPEICKFKKKNQNYESRKDFISYGAFNETWIKAEVKNYSSDDYYLFKLSTIERLAKEQGMYNTNNEQMKVTLQENGTVTVTDTETTTTLSKVTVDEICRLVKEDGEKVKLEVGKWYHYIGGLYVWNNGNPTYGFNSQKRFDDHYSFSTSNGAVEATSETVQQYLREEAVNRGFNGKLKFKPIGSHLEVIRDGNENTFGFDESLNQLLYCNYVIFRDGQWATILKPETITKAEAEKQLGKVITD